MQETLNLSSDLSGPFQLADWGVIEVSGPDASDFLHRLSSADIKKLPENQASLGAFLTGKGTLLGFGYFYRNSHGFYIVAGPHQVERLYSHLEQFHFQENLIIQKKLDSVVVLSNQPEAQKSVPSWQDVFNPDWNWCLVPQEKVPQHLSSFDRFHFLRVLHGMPYWGWEVFEGDLVLEAGLEKAVARNKGCYPGQEVVERIFTYGQVNWKLLRVELKSEKTLETGPCDFKILSNEKELGRLRSIVANPQCPQEGWGFARLRKEAWDEIREHEIIPGLFLTRRKD